MEEKKELINEIADYIIKTRSSFRATAKVFKLGKTTIAKYMNEYLPKISYKKYLEVKKIVLENSGELTEKDIERIKEVASLYLEGTTMLEISSITGYSFSQVQRDISDRLEIVAPDIFTETEKQKFNNVKSNSLSLEEKIRFLERIELEYLLVLRGYTQEQVAYLVNCSSSTVQRDLANLEFIDNKKYCLVKKKFKENQNKTKITSYQNSK